MNDDDLKRTITLLLKQIQECNGNAERAADELLQILHDQLYRQAQGLMRRQPNGHTLGPTALVNELWLKLFGKDTQPQINDRLHLLRLSARAMRQILVDHARKQRPAIEQRSYRDIEEVRGRFETRVGNTLDVHEALEKLHERDPELALITELRFFAELTVSDLAEIMNQSKRTVERKWEFARALLRRYLQ